MTLGDARKQLLQIGIRQVGALRRPPTDDEPASATLIFSADAKIVVPFALKTVYFLVVDSSDDDAKVNTEKYNALMRAIDHDKKNPSKSL